MGAEILWIVTLEEGAGAELQNSPTAPAPLPRPRVFCNPLQPPLRPPRSLALHQQPKFQND